MSNVQRPTPNVQRPKPRPADRALNVTALLLGGGVFALSGGVLCVHLATIACGMFTLAASAGAGVVTVLLHWSEGGVL